MKYIFFTLIFLHGAIHLMGFAKAFKLAQIEQLITDISKISGLAWLIVFILFLVTGIAFLAKTQWWYWLAIVTVIISTVLILLVWKDAKFGIIPNILILFVSLFSLSFHAFNNKVANEISTIMKQADTSKISIITKEQLNDLPYPVAKWLKTSGMVGKEKINTVWLSQKIRMKMKPGQKDWNEAIAEQYFSVENPAFIWKVKMNMPPFIKITGRDKFINGKGEMLIKMFSILNIVNEKGEKMDEGTLQRFLAEIVWFPSAALSQYISWEAIDSLSAKATMNYKGTTGSGTFYFNEQGDFVKFSTLRYKSNEADAQRYEWIVTVKEHSIKNGIKIPTQIEVTWVLENGNWTWLDLKITDVRYNTSIEID
ncbi:MAG: hypothetical protein K8R41_13450 [Bacteroidales bacterium]|nr:hypothetical protein [Bacteroidales bacterium]